MINNKDQVMSNIWENESIPLLENKIDIINNIKEIYVPTVPLAE